MNANDNKAALRELCADNVRLIDQLAALLARMDQQQYSQSQPPCDSGIGCHVRHILDHYDTFLDSLASGIVNYDERGRDIRTECHLDIANARLTDVRARLLMLTETALPIAINVIMDCGSRIATPSSIHRELQFLVSHTVHHDALIGAAAIQMGIALDAGYGIAPSTLRYQGKHQARQ